MENESTPMRAYHFTVAPILLRNCNVLLRHGASIENVARIRYVDVQTLRRDLAMLALADTLHELRRRLEWQRRSSM